MKFATTIVIVICYTIAAFLLNHHFLGDTAIGAGILGGLIGPWLVWRHS